MAKRLPKLTHSLPKIGSIGRSIFDPIWAEKEHATKGSELMFLLRGSARVVTRDYTIAGREGDTIYTPDAMPHRDVFKPGSEFEVYHVIFHWPGEKELLKHFKPKRLTTASRSASQQIGEAFKQLYHDFLTGGQYRDESNSLQLMQIILELCRNASGESQRKGKPANQRRKQAMQSVREIIDTRYDEALSLDVLADAMDLSPYYLSRIFSEEHGFTLSNYLTSVRMEKAADLLRHSSLPIAQVASRVGYRDPHYFGKVFRAQFGKAPSVFRDRSG